MGGQLFKNFSFFILIDIFSILFTYAQESIHEFGFDFLGNEIEDDKEIGL